MDLACLAGVTWLRYYGSCVVGWSRIRRLVQALRVGQEAQLSRWIFLRTHVRLERRFWCSDCTQAPFPVWESCNDTQGNYDRSSCEDSTPVRLRTSILLPVVKIHQGLFQIPTIHQFSLSFWHSCASKPLFSRSSFHRPMQDRADGHNSSKALPSLTKAPPTRARFNVWALFWMAFSKTETVHRLHVFFMSMLWCLWVLWQWSASEKLCQRSEGFCLGQLEFSRLSKQKVMIITSEGFSFHYDAWRIYCDELDSMYRDSGNRLV